MGMDRMMGDASVQSLEDVYREHRVALLRLAYLVGASRELAEDVVQAAFASAQPRWDQVDDAFAYLKRAVVNQVKDDQRRWYRRLKHPTAHSADQLSVLPPEVDETWGVISALPWPQRAVVVLHYYEDLPLNEIAEILGRPAPTVRSDHRRALERLRKALR